MKQLVKQTSKGEAVITVTNGTATATVNGQSTGCNSGMVQYVKPFGPNNQFVAGICKIALTQAEAKEVEKMLADRESSTTGTVDSTETMSHTFTAEVRRAGNINKFAKGGAL